MTSVLRTLARPEALAELVRREWGVPVDRVVLYRTLANDVYRVDPGHYLKVYRHGWRTPGEVAWECDVITHLITAGLPIAPVVPRLDGALAGVWPAPEGPRPLVLLTAIAGKRPEPPFAPGLHRAYGRLIAGVHTAGETFRSTYTRRPKDLTNTLDEPLADVLPWLDPADRHRAESVAAAARAGLAAAPPSQGLCHGDATLDNVLIVAGTEDNPALVLFDFDLAGYGYLASDFPFQAKNFEHFLAGYREIRPVAAADLAAERWLDAVAVIEGVRFHLVTKAAWRGLESYAEGWLDQALADLREVSESIATVSQ